LLLRRAHLPERENALISDVLGHRLRKHFVEGKDQRQKGHGSASESLERKDDRLEWETERWGKEVEQAQGGDRKEESSSFELAVAETF